MIWLSTNFDLPRIPILPNIEIVPRTEISALRHKGFVWVAPRDIVIESQRGPPHAREVIAVYDDDIKTIYLPEGWTGAHPRNDRSWCTRWFTTCRISAGAPAREELDYAAQDRWLGLSGLNLADEFEIDPFTLVVSTRCIY